jgi:Fur family transcriptional regulator, iron response regulator
MNDQTPIRDLSAAPAFGTLRRGCPLSDLRDKLRRVGLRPTRQRVSLGWLLFGKGDRHITAEVLFDEAMLRQLAVDGSKAYFDTNPSEHHHFFIEGEDALVDVPGEAIAVGDLPAPPEGLEIAGVEVIVRLRRKA